MGAFFTATTIVSSALLLLVLFSVRRSHIRVEYSVSWIAASTALLALSLSPATLARVARLLGIESAPMALLLLASGVFLLVFFRFSVIISDLKDANIAMAQRLAILEFRLQSRNESN